MFDCMFDTKVFWLGFFIGGIICIGIFEFIQFVFMSALGLKKIEKELKRTERKEPKL